MKIIKAIRKNTIVILLITILMMYLVLKKDFKNIISTLVNVDMKYIIFAFCIFLFSIILKAYISYKIVNDKNNYSIKEAIKHNIIVQFFNGITPFSTGGQPVEIYMLTEHNINANKGTMFILQNFILYQIALVALGFIAVIYNGIYGLFPRVVLLRRLVFIGFIINVLVAVIIIIISYSKKLTESCINFFIHILSKIRIIKNEEITRKRCKERLFEFHECAKNLREKKMLFIVGVIINILSLICLYLIPLFIVYSMHDFSSITPLISLVSSAYVFLIGAFVPIPGASGGIEYGFLAFFSNFLGNSKVVAVLLIWRFITYYLPMIIGAVVFNIDERSKQL